MSLLLLTLTFYFLLAACFFLYSLKKDPYIKSDLNQLESKGYPTNCSISRINCSNDNECKLFCKRQTGTLLVCKDSECREVKSMKIPCSNERGGTLVYFLNKIKCLCTHEEYFAGRACNEAPIHMCTGGSILNKKYVIENLDNPSSYCKCTKPKQLMMIKVKKGLVVPMCLTSDEYILYNRLRDSV